MTPADRKTPETDAQHICFGLDGSEYVSIDSARKESGNGN